MDDTKVKEQRLSILAQQQNFDHSYLERDTLPSILSSPQSIDAWRHRRMYNFLDPIISIAPGARWLTLGDGHFGTDAHYLKCKGCHAVASSVSNATLDVAKNRGFIDEYIVYDACDIKCGDDSYDFVLCKEAYHHFERPPLAFYEMYRVAKFAVILIEPQYQPPRIFDCMKILAKKILRAGQNSEYESSGNYICRLNVHENLRMLQALNHKRAAYRLFNDFFVPSIAKRRDTFAWIIQHMGLAIQNLLCRLRLMNYGLAVFAIIKDTDKSNAVTRNLEKSGFTIINLPPNPYLGPQR